MNERNEFSKTESLITIFDHFVKKDVHFNFIFCGLNIIQNRLRKIRMPLHIMFMAE